MDKYNHHTSKQIFYTTKIAERQARDQRVPEL